MSDIFKITCPRCKKPFDAGSAFNSHFEKTKLENEKNLKKAELDAEKKYKSKIEDSEREIEKAKREAAKKAGLDVEKKYKSKIENSEKEIEKAKREAAKKAELDAEKKYKSKIENSEKEIEKAKREALKKAELNAEKKYKSQIETNEKEIEKAKRESELRAKKMAEQEIKKEMEKKDAEILKIKKREEITNERLKKRTEEMTSLMKDKDVELQGETQERNLEAFLKKKFPEDNVEEVKKGAKGGDCILTINYKNKKNIAKIYFESKDTTSFNEKWADKLLNDMKDKGIANGIIVASETCLPSDFDKYTSYVERHGNSIAIIPMENKIIHAVVSGIRSILILKARENKDHQIPDVMKKCWANLNGPNFQLPVKSMVSEIIAMEKIFKQERTSFERMSANKDKIINGVRTNLIKIVTSFTRSVGDIFPEDLLEHKDDKFIE